MIRTLPNSPIVEQKAAEEAEPAEEAGPPPAPKMVPAVAGTSRFVWDMRVAPSFPGLTMYQATTQAPHFAPGTYQFRFVAGTKTLTRSFTINKDLRLTGITQADLDEQIRFAREIQDAFSLTNDTVARIRRIKANISTRMAKTQNAATKGEGEQLIEALTKIEGFLYQYRNSATKDPLNFPPQLNNKLGSLLSVVGTGEFPATDASYAVFRELHAELEEQITSLDRLWKRELPVFNAAAGASGLAPLREF